MKSESKRLKLTAQNIKSIIVKSNKNLKNISDKEDELDLIVESRRQRRYKERKIESSMFKGSKSSIANKATNAVVGGSGDLFNNVLQLGSLLLLGSVVTEIPKIAAGQSSFMDGLKPVFETLKGGLNAIGDVVQGITTPIKQGINDAKKGNKEGSSNDVSKVKKELNIKEADNLLKAIRKDAENLEKVVGDHGISDAEIEKFIKENTSKTEDSSKGNKTEQPKSGGNISPMLAYPLTSQMTDNRAQKISKDRFKTILPLGNPVFTSPMGPRWGRMHHGIDIGVDANSPVHSQQDGFIENVGANFGGVGGFVVVQHGDKSANLYGHVTNVSVKKGDRVQKGQKLAEIIFYPGEGGSDQSHLHLERFAPDGNRIDPYPYLGKQSKMHVLPNIKPVAKTYNLDGKVVSAGAVKTVFVTQRVIVPS